MTDLKEVLMKLGNRLVLEKQWEPAWPGFLKENRRWTEIESTTILALMAHWFNTHLEAREFLRELGFEWSMPEGADNEEGQADF